MNDDCWKKYKLMIVAAPKKTLDRLSAAVSCYNRMKNKDDFLDSVSRVYQTWAEAADRAGVFVPVEERGMVF
jgi:TPP-dependent trihydroxycyclohexane-1,2-dione (THcHDO) dehydratase